jgi:trehalose 6-phosphate phosphatase
LNGCAVFLDIDGTLIDLAATPDAVFVPPHLHVLLRHLAQRTHGALALISGRSLADIDRLIGPGIAVAAEHGALLRDAAGQVFEKMPESTELAALRAPLQALVAAHPGSLFEQKQYGLSVHWRKAPQAAAELCAGATALANGHPRLELQPAHAALEIRLRGPGKAQALDRFMRMPPFTGQRPIFIGDDLTDEPAIARAVALGGLGLHVARDFAGKPAAVLAWLEAALAEKEGAAHG